MKTAFNLTMVLLFSIAMTPVMAQQQSPNTIVVYGNAEKAIEPDEIILTLTLQEYTDNSTGMKKLIHQLEEDLLQSAKSIGVSGDAVLVDNINGYSNYGGYDDTAEFMVSKNYQVRLNSMEKLNQFISKVGGQGLMSANITQFGHSKSEEMRNELKAMAIKNARQEAELLVAGTGKKVGELIGIEVFNDYGAYYDSYAPFVGKIPASAGGKVTLKPITLRYSVKVMYELK